MRKGCNGVDVLDPACQRPAECVDMAGGDEFETNAISTAKIIDVDDPCKKPRAEAVTPSHAGTEIVGGRMRVNPHRMYACMPLLRSP